MTVTVKELGVAGYGTINNVPVFMTSGSVSKEHNISYINPISMPPPNGWLGAEYRTKVKYSDGTKLVTGSIAFDLNLRALSLVSKNSLLRRGYKFNIEIYDGNDGFIIPECYAQSFSVSGGVGGLISGNLSFVTAKDWKKSGGNNRTYIKDEPPLGYWTSGNTNVRDWSFEFSQDTNPVYLNAMAGENDSWPRYIKIGATNFVLTVTTLEQIFQHDTIAISSAYFTLIGNTRSEGYNFSGIEELSTYTHTFETAASLTGGSDDEVIV